MKKFFLLLFLLPAMVAAQEKIVVNLSSGEQLYDKVTFEMQYVLPEFKEGLVYFKDGRRIKSMLNYNVLLGEMHFIDERENILALGSLKDILVVVIDSKRFFPFKDAEFCEELLVKEDARLCVRRIGNVAEYSKMGAYGMNQSLASIQTFNTVVSDNSRIHKTKWMGEVRLSVDTIYYAMNKKGKYTQIKNLKSITKLFSGSGNSAKIEAFVKENNTDFTIKDDLVALVEFCSNL